MILHDGMYVRELSEYWGQKRAHCRTFRIVIEARSQYGIGMHVYSAIQVGVPSFVKRRVHKLLSSVTVDGNYVEEIDQFEGMLLEVSGGMRT